MSDAKSALIGLLNYLGNSTQFVAAGTIVTVPAGLVVDGIGDIPCPIPPADARRLIEQATQAPYGCGEETVLDTNVRRVWQLEPSQFRLDNPDWGPHLGTIVDAVKAELGIADKVTPHLYKLLIYEKGSFFAPHRDTEKVPRMFATLVVCLPSRHEGGALIVRHDGEERRIEFDTQEGIFRTQYAAFYADCRHEIQPVTSGYRVCLVYNLALASKKAGPSAPYAAAAVSAAAELLRQCFAAPEARRLVVPLEHQYTEAGLSPRQLKGSDRAQVEVLGRAAAALDYSCFFALLRFEQTGNPDYDSMDDYEYRSRRRSRWDSDGEDEDEADHEVNDAVQMQEVFEEGLTLHHWLDPDGRPQPFGEMHVEREELLDPEEVDTWPAQQQVHEATGNEGATLERWYHGAAVVLWPRDRYFAVLAAEGQLSALSALEEMAGRGKQADVAACRAFAVEIMAAWRPQGGIYRPGAAPTARMLAVLERIGTAELVAQFLREVLPKDFDGSEGLALAAACRRFGWGHFAEALRGLIIKPENYDAHSRLEKLATLCEQVACAGRTADAERVAACRPMVEALSGLLREHDARERRQWDHAESRRLLLTSTAHALAAVGAVDELDGLVTHAIALPKLYQLREDLLPAVLAMSTWLNECPALVEAVGRLRAHCLAELQAATAVAPAPPADWTRSAAVGCTCGDCQLLAAFLKDPTRSEARFQVVQERRRHLEHQIENRRLDCKYSTLRVGSPHTLLCKKTQATYERLRQQYEEDCQAIPTLEALLPTAVRPKGRRKGKK